MKSAAQEVVAKSGVIADHCISNLATFQKVTEEPRQVAGLYFYKELDCLIDLAHKVSCDFFKRPHLHTDLGRVTVRKTDTSVSGILAKLNARYGSDETFPSTEQRDRIYHHIFSQGESSSAPGDGEFLRLRNELLKAAAAFAERVFDTGEEMLKASVRSAHSSFKAYIRGLDGDSLRWSKEEALSSLTENTAYTTLRSKGIGSVFGVSNAPKLDWPYVEDSNADKLVEQISQQLAKEENAIHLTREYFSNLQRVALRGAEALATVIDFDERRGANYDDDEDLRLLITKCYVWRTALESIKTNS